MGQQHRIVVKRKARQRRLKRLKLRAKVSRKPAAAPAAPAS